MAETLARAPAMRPGPPGAVGAPGPPGPRMAPGPASRAVGQAGQRPMPKTAVKPPAQMAQKVVRPELDDEETALDDEADADETQPLGRPEVNPLPGHMDHYCTNPMWIAVLAVALAGLYFPIQKSIQYGDTSKFFRGFDYQGRMCGRDLCDNGVPCGSLTYFCARPEDVKPDTAHPICVDVCPTSNQTSHICFDQTSGTVALPDAPTVQFNMKCLQQRHLEEENSKHLISRGMERFKEAGSFEGLFMDSAHSIKRAQLLMLYVFLVATITGIFYMTFLHYCAAFLIHVSLMLMMIVPTIFGIVHLFFFYKGGSFHAAMNGEIEVQTALLSGIVGVAIGLVMCCTLAKISRGIQTAEGCIVATTECMFEIPSILLEPLVSLAVKILLCGPVAMLAIVYASTGRMLLLQSNNHVHRDLSLQAEQWAFLVFITFMFFWLAELTHNMTQYVLAFVSERWYFTPYVDDSKVNVPHSCMVFEAIGNMLRYHLGSCILGAFLKTFFRIPKVIAFCLYLLGCCEQKPKSSDEPEHRCSCQLAMKLLGKEGYMDMAITSSEYCQATEQSMLTLQDSSAELVLNWTQLIFQAGGWAMMTGVSALFGAVAVGMPEYNDPAGPLFLQEPDAVIVACALLGLMVSVSFMNVFDVVGDTILYCFALEEQRHKQVSGGYDPYEEPNIFQRCTCRSKNDSFLGWLWGDESEEEEQKMQYAPKSLMQALANAK